MYPPLLYEIIAYFLLVVLIANMASRLSVVDENYRQLAQEIALIKNLTVEDDGADFQTSYTQGET
jgi:hypothetical protein